MRFSMQLWTQRVQERDPLWTDYLAEQMRLMEAYGFDSAIALNHYMGGLQALQPSAVLGWAAAQATTLRLGTGIVILPLLHPVNVAETWASLDVLSRGRIFLGAGLGYRENEFESFGIPLRHRPGRFEESIEVIRRLWTGEVVSFEGRHFHLREQRIGTLPVQARLPIWVGAAHEVSVARAARIGDGWLIPPDCKPKRLLSLLDLYIRTRDEFGHPDLGEFPLERQLILDEDPERAMAEAVPYMRAEWAEYAERGFEWFQRRFDDLIEKAFLIGTPESVAERLKEYQAMGIDHVVFRCHWGAMPLERAVETLNLFGRRVLPLLEEGPQ